MKLLGIKTTHNRLEIPYRTVQDWELGNRKMQDYLLRLIAYKLKAEQLLKNREDADGESNRE